MEISLCPIGRRGMLCSLLMLTVAPHRPVTSFTPNTPTSLLSSPSSSVSFHAHGAITVRPTAAPLLVTGRTDRSVGLRQSNNDNDALDEETRVKEEKARLEIWSNRRKQIRSTLKSAENIRTFRLANGYVPDEDDNGTGSALTITAFVIAFGVVLLRVGGRAALVSTLGLDFAQNNPELQTQMDSLLAYTGSLGLGGEVALFTLAWTVVKVFCFDAGGIVLALSAGVIFGGVLQGALMSASAATVGSTVAFGLAKIDTPVRAKALELLEEYPSLRGIEKVVARDGVKAVLTLRLAPVLPIPIGLYNYVYGVTNVPVTDFMAGIFLGSLKPYLLDSYLGTFGKSLVDGTSQQSDTQDSLLLIALGVSVLIGVFASQLATETWEAVQIEMEAESEKDIDADVEEDDGVTRSVMGTDLPQWVVGFQLALKAATIRMDDTIGKEFEAKVWNYTNIEDIPDDSNPAMAEDSPEVLGKDKGFEFVNAICDGIVLSPVLFTTFLQYSDPMFNEEEELLEIVTKRENAKNSNKSSSAASLVGQSDNVKSVDNTNNLSLSTAEMNAGVNDANSNMINDVPISFAMSGGENVDEYLFETLGMIRSTLKYRLEAIDAEVND